MKYRGEYVLSRDQLNPGDTYTLALAFGNPLIAILDDTDLLLGLPARDIEDVAGKAMWFSALVASRLASVVDYFAYAGDFGAEQVRDFQIAWPEVQEEGTESRVFLETFWRLQDEHVPINFVDNLLARLCLQFQIAVEHQGLTDDTKMLAELHGPCLEEMPECLKVIDQALYDAGVPLLNERFQLSTPTGELHRWAVLEPGHFSDHRLLLTYELQELFLAMRSDPINFPPGACLLTDVGALSICIDHEAN